MPVGNVGRQVSGEGFVVSIVWVFRRACSANPDAVWFLSGRSDLRLSGCRFGCNLGRGCPGFNLCSEVMDFLKQVQILVPKRLLLVPDFLNFMSGRFDDLALVLDDILQVVDQVAHHLGCDSCFPIFQRREFNRWYGCGLILQAR